MVRLPSHTTWLSCALLLALAASSHAQREIEKFMPVDTQGLLVVPDVNWLESQFDRTEVGKLAANDVMQPFRESFEKQLEKQITDDRTLGLTFDDIGDIAAGSVGIAVIDLPNTFPASTILIDVTDRLDRAQIVVNKAAQTLVNQNNAKRSEQTVDGVVVTTYTLPEAEGLNETDLQKTYFIHKNWLCATQNPAVAAEIINLLNGNAQANISDTKAWKSIFATVDKVEHPAVPVLHFYMDPIGLLEARKYGEPPVEEKPGQPDTMTLLKDTGFTGLEALGGRVFLAVGNQDIQYRIKVYAPGPFKESMRILSFANEGDLEPPAWVPDVMASYGSFNWDLLTAFDNFGPLFNRMFGEDESNVWQRVLDGLQKDVNGPQVDLRKLVTQLENRISFYIDYKLPIDPDSERRVWGVPIKEGNDDAVTATIDKIFIDDPTMKLVEADGYRIFESVPPPPKRGPRRPGRPKPKAKDPVKMSVTVAHGTVFLASDTEELLRALKQVGQSTVARTVDYRVVKRELDAHQKDFGIQTVAARTFSFRAESVRPTWELLRAGKMGEAKTMLARVINAILIDDEEKETRQQEIDAATLPAFTQVRRYFGPAGAIAVTIDDGWYICGITYTKQPHVAAVPNGTSR